MTEKRNNLFENSGKLSSTFRLEAVRHGRGMSILLSGIVGVEGFNDTQIMLKSHGCRIEVMGKRLNLTVFENNSLEITGKIEGVDFKYGKN